MGKVMKVAAAQMDIKWHDRGANYQNAHRLAEEARSLGVDLMVMPEMFSTGFSMDTSLTPEPLDGPTPDLLRTLALKGNMFTVGGFALAGQNGRPRNVSLAVDRDGNDLALYAKIHQIALLAEDRYYDPGTGSVTFDMEGLRSACFVCYDLRFPELFRSVAGECGLIMVIASWPSSRQGHWDILLRARAVENQCFVIGVNRVGSGGGLVFTGGSAIIDPMGRVLNHEGDREKLIISELDKNYVEEVRASFPFLRSRKPYLFK